MIKKSYLALRGLYKRLGLEKIRGIHKLINIYIGGTITDIIGILIGFRFKREDNLGYKIRLLFKWYEHETVAACKNVIKPGMVVMDIGASIGYYTSLFSNITGRKGVVYSFEPEKSNFNILTKNVLSLKYRNVTVINKAVSNINGKVKFYKARLSALGSLYKFKDTEGKTLVEAITIDRFLAKNRIKKVDFVKIDTEGAEINVIKGMKNLIKQLNAIKMVIEVNPKALKSAGSNVKKLYSLLNSFDFKTRIIEKYDEGSYNILCFK